MKKGFTLVEAVVTMVLIGIMAVVFGLYIREGFSAWEWLSGQKTLASSCRLTVFRMNRELRRIRSLADLTTYTSTEVQFTDIDGANVDFTQSGTDLLRNGSVLLEHLVDPNGLYFHYLDATGTDTTTRDNIRTIVFRLTASREGNRVVVESAARIRNQ